MLGIILTLEVVAVYILTEANNLILRRNTKELGRAE